MSKFRIEIIPDSDCANPLDPKEFDLAWTLHSFSRRHGNYADPESLGLSDSLGADGWPKVTNPGLGSKLRAGLAFFVSCYQHSGVQWGLPGEVHQCQWDTARVAGLLVWEHDRKELHKGYDERKKDARIALAQYTAWANGQCYGYAVTEIDDDGEEIEQGDSCFGFIVADFADANYFFENVGQSIPCGARVEWVDPCGLVGCYRGLPAWLDGDRKADTASADREADKASEALA